MPEPTDLLRVALAQINPTVGDIRGNARKISDYTARARDEGAALVVFPELALTGYPPDKVSPSGQLEPPNAADFPTAGSHISKMIKMQEPVLPFVELPRPLQESGIIGKGGAAGFLGKAYDPYRMYQDPAETVKLEDLSLRKEIPAERLKDRFELLKGINESMPELEKALNASAVDEYYGKAYDLVLSGKARDAMDLTP